MGCRCLDAFASRCYTCTSKCALTTTSIFKVLVSVAIIVIVVLKFENVNIELTGISSLADLGLSNITSKIFDTDTSAPGGSGAGAPAPGGTDLNTTAGPLHVDAACLLQQDGNLGLLESDHTMCTYAYVACGISLVATLIMALLLWCTCRMCGIGPLLDLVFAILGVLWWLAAALVLQYRTSVDMSASPASISLIMDQAASAAGGGAAAPALRPPPVWPPPAAADAPGAAPGGGGNGTSSGEELADQLKELVQSWVPDNLPQWRNALIGLAWGMVIMFALEAVLMLVETCGCMWDCCSCCCYCCPERAESKWRDKWRQKGAARQSPGSEEYVEMCNLPASTGSSAVPRGSGGSRSTVSSKAPTVVVIARSDAQAAEPAYGTLGGDAGGGRKAWWRRG